MGLQTLELSRNKIGVAGARALAKALPPTLEELNLGEVGFGDEGLVALAAALPRARAQEPGMLSLLDKQDGDSSGIARDAEPASAVGRSALRQRSARAPPASCVAKSG
mgnify:CR=1 FL=1